MQRSQSLSSWDFPAKFLSCHDRAPHDRHISAGQRVETTRKQDPTSKGDVLDMYSSWRPTASPHIYSATSSPAASRASTVSRSSSPELTLHGSDSSAPPRSRVPLFYTLARPDQTSVGCKECGACGASLDQTASVCEICGENVQGCPPSRCESLSGIHVPHCSGCGAEADASARVCEICGEAVRLPPTRWALLHSREMRRQMICKCDSCGAACDHNASTCEICGESMRPTAATARGRGLSRTLSDVQPVPFDRSKMKPIVWGTGELQFKIGGEVRKVHVPVMQSVGEELVPLSASGGAWM